MNICPGHGKSVENFNNYKSYVGTIEFFFLFNRFVSVLYERVSTEHTSESTDRPMVSAVSPQDECLFYVYFFAPVTACRPSIPPYTTTRKGPFWRVQSPINRPLLHVISTNVVDDTAVISSGRGRSTTGAGDRGFHEFLMGFKFVKTFGTFGSEYVRTDFIVKSDRSCNRSTP